MSNTMACHCSSRQLCQIHATGHVRKNNSMLLQVSQELKRQHSAALVSTSWSSMWLLADGECSSSGWCPSAALTLNTQSSLFCFPQLWATRLRALFPDQEHTHTSERGKQGSDVWSPQHSSARTAPLSPAHRNALPTRVTEKSLCIPHCVRRQHLTLLQLFLLRCLGNPCKLNLAT